MSCVPSLALPEYKHSGKSIYESLILSESAENPKDARRLIEEGRVFRLKDEDTFDDAVAIKALNHRVNAGDVIRVGKRKFMKIT